MTFSNFGTVYLVGAGPGDPELISVRGLRCIERADVVCYDRLVHPSLLEAAPESAERIFVGKQPGRHVVPQDLISDLLVDRARGGSTVVRLKGGDPFVFGRGGEECLALQRAGIPFEVVPGISSAISAPAFAGIPVTHRGVSSSFTVVTGHTCDGSGAEQWQILARSETLVILMGLSRVRHIADSLIAAGRSPETPAAIVASGSTGAQQVAEGVLADIAERAWSLKSPATIVVGDVVRLRRQIGWFTPSESSRDFDASVAGRPAGAMRFPDIENDTLNIS